MHVRTYAHTFLCIEVVGKKVVVNENQGYKASNAHSLRFTSVHFGISRFVYHEIKLAFVLLYFVYFSGYKTNNRCFHTFSLSVVYL